MAFYATIRMRTEIPGGTGEGRIVFPRGTSLTHLSTKLRRVIMGASDHQKSPVGMSLLFFIIAVGLACLYFIFWA